MSKASDKVTFDISDKASEEFAKKEFNEKNSGKIENQNQHHNARKEAFGQSQQQRYR